MEPSHTVFCGGSLLFLVGGSAQAMENSRRETRGTPVFHHPVLVCDLLGWIEEVPLRTTFYGGGTG